MGYYPIFVEMEHRRVLLVGGGNVAREKIGKLLDAGADVTVVAPELSPEVREYVESGRVRNVLEGVPSNMLWAVFSPDGHRIVTAGLSNATRVWRRVRPEWWWGVFWLPQFWFTVLFATGFIWSLRRDYKRLMLAPAG